MLDSLILMIGKWLANFLSRPSRHYEPFSVSDPKTLRTVLQPCDILLIEGNQRISTTIKYLTQSTWSHAALYIGNVLQHQVEEGKELPVLLEADIAEGVIAVPLSKYAHFNTRICRAVNLREEDRGKIIEFAVARLGYHYDLKNLIDLARYLFPRPPVPVRWRRRMLALGSGDPTRAICSALIAQAFQSVKYPVLPTVEVEMTQNPEGAYIRKEILHIRHHSLFTPRDFDISPYFHVIKPTIEKGFDYKSVMWD